jgi:hypothetical protein
MSAVTPAASYLIQDNWGTVDLANVNAAGSYKAGTIACSGKGHLAFEALSNFPLYASGTDVQTPMLAVRNAADNDGIKIYGPISGSGDTVPAPQAGLTFAFDFWITTQGTVTIKIDLDSAFQVFQLARGGQAIMSAGTGSQLSLLRTAPYANAAAPNLFGDYAHIFMPVRVVIVVRRQRSYDPKWQVETWVKSEIAGHYMTCIGKQWLTLGNNCGFYFLTQFTNSGITPQILQLGTFSLGDSFLGDPSTSDSFNGYISNSIRGGGLINSGYAYNVRDKLHTVLLGDATGDGTADATNRLLTSADGVAWDETSFPGFDSNGTASTTLGLLDVQNTASSADPSKTNLNPAFSVTRDAVNLAGGTLGDSTDYTTIFTYAAATNALSSGPYQVTAGGTISAARAKLEIDNATTTVKLGLYTYASGNVGKVGTIVGLSDAAVVGVGTAWVDFTFSTPVTVAANTDYMWVLFTISGGIAYCEVSGVNGGSIHTYKIGTVTPPTGSPGDSGTFGVQISDVGSQPASFYATIPGAVDTTKHATIAIALGSDASVTITLADDIGPTTTTLNYSTNAGTMASVKTDIEAISGSHWHVTLGSNSVAPLSPNSSYASTAPARLLHPMSATDCYAGNSHAATVSTAIRPQAPSLGYSPGGEMLAVVGREIDARTGWLTGRFNVPGTGWTDEFIIAGGPLQSAASDGFVVANSGSTPNADGSYTSAGTHNGKPYYHSSESGLYIVAPTPVDGAAWSMVDSDPSTLDSATHVWRGPALDTGPAGSYGPVTGATGGVLVTVDNTSYTALSGGDGYFFGDDRACLKLFDGRWLIACSYYNRSASLSNAILLSKPGLSISELMSGSVHGYSFVAGVASWTATPAWTQLAGADGIEPNVCQLANGQLVWVGRDSGGGWISVGTVSATSQAIAWHDPTYAANASKSCVADGGYNSANSVRRPLLWSGSGPLSVVADNVNKLVYFISETQTGSQQIRGCVEVWRCTQDALLNAEANGGLVLEATALGQLSGVLGVYTSFQLANGRLCGVMANGQGSGGQGANFFVGPAASGSGSGNSGGNTSFSISDDSESVDFQGVTI